MNRRAACTILAAGFASGLVSLFVSGVESLFVSCLDSLLLSAEDSAFESDLLSAGLPSPSFAPSEVEPELSVFSGFLESLMYQPVPLNTIPTGYNSLLTAPLHSGQIEIGSSFIL